MSVVLFYTQFARSAIIIGTGTGAGLFASFRGIDFSSESIVHGRPNLPVLRQINFDSKEDPLFHRIYVSVISCAVKAAIVSPN